MPNEFRLVMPWALTVGTIFIVPCCLVVLLELHPGTTCVEHLPATLTILAGLLLLLIRPATLLEPQTPLPEAHVEVFRYAIRSGVLPIASLFSDWSDHLVQVDRLLNKAISALPLVSGTAMAVSLCGMIMHAESYIFFLGSTLAAAVFGLAAFAQATTARNNITAIAGRLRAQERLLSSPWR